MIRLASVNNQPYFIERGETETVVYFMGRCLTYIEDISYKIEGDFVRKLKCKRALTSKLSIKSA